MSRTPAFFSPCWSWVLPVAGQAAKVKVWHQQRPSNYEKAQLTHAVVSSEGTLRLSRRCQPLAGLDATHVWDVVEDARRQPVRRHRRARARSTR